MVKDLGAQQKNILDKAKDTSTKMDIKDSARPDYINPLYL
jgi:hypothetical protein